MTHKNITGFSTKIHLPYNELLEFQCFYSCCVLYLDFLFSACSGLDKPNLGCFLYLERVPGLAMYGLVSM